MKKRKVPSVLIAVWEKDLRDTIQYVFEAEKWEVSVVQYGDQALELMQGKEIPDLIILSWFLGPLGGEEVCRRLRRLPQTKQTPVFLILLDTRSWRREEALAAGATDTFALPLSLVRLVERAQALLGSKIQSVR